MKEISKVYSTDFVKANALNKLLSLLSIYTRWKYCTTRKGNVLYPDMPTIEVDAAGIAKLLLEIDPYKAMGPDKILPQLLKESSYEIAP